MQPDSPSRVLFVVGYLRGNDGITTHMMDLADGLLERGWDVAIASCMNEDADHTVRGPAWFEERGVSHYSVPFPDGRKPNSKPWDAARAWPRFQEVLADFQPSLLHLHALSLAPYAALQRLLGGVPYVTTCHIQPHADRLRIRVGAQVNRFFPSFLGSRSVAVSSELEVALQRDLGIPPSQIHVIPYGVDAKHFRPPTPSERIAARANFGLAADDFVVSTIGRLNPVKRQDLLIEATALLRERGLPATALVAGSGDWKPALEDRITTLNAGQYVKMLGFSDARTVIWASDALSLSSSWESFGIVIPEAMLCGVVPVRTPAAGATDQIRNGVDGFVVPFDDAEALADRLERLATNPDRRADMADSAYRSVRRRFTADRMVRDMISLYNATLEESSASLASSPA